MYKATKLFNQYRNKVLGLPSKDFRALQSGKAVSVPAELLSKYPQLFQEDKKEVKK